jgi:phage tail protein X
VIRSLLEAGPGEGLSDASIRAVIENLAWHEYGHALSVTRASTEQRADGVRLLGLLTEPMRDAIGYPDTYRAHQVFDEVIAHVYALMIGRAVRGEGYGRPDFLHRSILSAFKEVVPWPPSPR